MTNCPSRNDDDVIDVELVRDQFRRLPVRRVRSQRQYACIGMLLQASILAVPDLVVRFGILRKPLLSMQSCPSHSFV
jgi:hypothetical protein